MNSVFVETFSKKRFNKRKSRSSNLLSSETRALISRDVTDSDSEEEEITLLDIRRVKKKREEKSELSSLRKIKRPSSSAENLSNGGRKIADPFLQCDICYYDVVPGDTLESISIKYQCSVSDIKRANNLISRQDFYALKTLKIPVKKHSLLTEILSTDANANKESSSTNSTQTEEAQTHSANAGSSIEDSSIGSDIRSISIGMIGRCPSPQDSAAFFQRMDQDLVNIMLCTNSKKESLEAAAVALTTKQIRPLVRTDPYDTADCGIQWNYLVVFVIVFVVVVPAAVALYLYFRSEHEHHVGLSNNATELGKS